MDKTVNFEQGTVKFGKIGILLKRRTVGGRKCRTLQWISPSILLPFHTFNKFSIMTTRDRRRTLPPVQEVPFSFLYLFLLLLFHPIICHKLWIWIRHCVCMRINCRLLRNWSKLLTTAIIMERNRCTNLSVQGIALFPLLTLNLCYLDKSQLMFCEMYDVQHLISSLSHISYIRN